MNLVSIVQVLWLMFTVGIGISPRTQRVWVVMNLHDPGFLQTSGFSTSFANDKYTSAVPNASVGFGYNLNWCVMIPDYTVLIMPPPLSHYCLEGRDWGRDGNNGRDLHSLLAFVLPEFDQPLLEHCHISSTFQERARGFGRGQANIPDGSSMQLDKSRAYVHNRIHSYQSSEGFSFDGQHFCGHLCTMEDIMHST